jgi:hypothetical protein
MEQENLVKKNTPRDLFLHLLAVVTLYWSAISFTALLWQFINNFVVDALDYYSAEGSLSIIRFSVSSILIVFPVFILTSWFLNKIYIRESQVRESKIRKWLIYLTLFITSLIIIGDLIFVINSFLGGEVTVRFILKALSVILVAGIVLSYYLDDVRRDTPTKLAKPFAWSAGVLVLAVVACAFFVVGSPNSARLIQFDQQKISDLQSIQYQVVNYWQLKEKLPENLSVLNDPISNYIIPADSQTGKAYEYVVKDAVNLSFELCAEFNKEGKDQYSQTRPAMYPEKGVVDNWNHTEGRVCFERKIDKDLYPPFNKLKQ